MFDIYTYLFQSNKFIGTKSLIDYNDLHLFIKKEKTTKKNTSQNTVVYELYGHARIEYNLDHYYGYTTIFSDKKLNEILTLIDIINKFNHINFNVIESKIEYHGVDLVTVYVLNDMEIPYIKHKYNYLQPDIPLNDTELLKSNSYYYSRYVNQIKGDITVMSMSKFIKFLKKLYGESFDKIEYLQEVKSLEKFKMLLPKFMKEKARLPGFDEPENSKDCFDFFYHRMKLILDDLHIRPSHFIKFY